MFRVPASGFGTRSGLQNWRISADTRSPEIEANLVVQASDQSLITRQGHSLARFRQNFRACVDTSVRLVRDGTISSNASCKNAIEEGSHKE